MTRTTTSRISVATCAECDFAATGNTAMAAAAAHARKTGHEVHATYAAAYVYQRADIS